MKQEVVNKKSGYPVELTEMQRRFCEYLVMNEGRTTGKDAGLSGLAEGEVITFEVEEGAKGPSAVNLQKG